jgi:hypothetical protein
MANKWLAHVKKTMKKMKSRGTYKKGMGLGAVIKEAKKSWHKGGAEESDSDMEMPAVAPEVSEPSAAGRRRRRSMKKTRRARKH